MLNLCSVCHKPLKKRGSKAHSGLCYSRYHVDNNKVNPEYFKKQIQGGFAYDEASVLL